MKKILTVCVFILSIGFVYHASAQTITPPEFPGGKKAFSDFLAKNLKWPSDNMNHTQGVVVVGFFVEKDGSLTDIHIEKSLAKAFDKEALRVISMSPKWIPAIKNNRPIKSKYTEPIKFEVSE